MEQPVSHTATPPTTDLFLSFDCATKTFAFVIVATPIDIAAHLRTCMQDYARLQRGVTKAKCQAFLRRWRALIRLFVARTDDLAPGRADNSVHTVERVRLIMHHVRECVDPALDAVRQRLCAAGEVPRVHIIIEFQMGQNPAARAAAHALCAHYCDHDTTIVGPAWKNTISFGPECDYSVFAAKYAQPNKQHTVANYIAAQRLFDFGPHANDRITVGKSEHVADAFAQACVCAFRKVYELPPAF